MEVCVCVFVRLVIMLWSVSGKLGLVSGSRWMPSRCLIAVRWAIVLYTYISATGWRGARGFLSKGLNALRWCTADKCNPCGYSEPRNLYISLYFRIVLYIRFLCNHSIRLIYSNSPPRIGERTIMANMLIAVTLLSISIVYGDPNCVPIGNGRVILTHWVSRNYLPI